VHHEAQRDHQNEEHQALETDNERRRRRRRRRRRKR
jgi:hypothetical protein